VGNFDATIGLCNSKVSLDERQDFDMAKTSKNRSRSATVVDAHIGQKIRTRRILLGLSQTELADAAGITFQQIQKYEKGVNRVGAGRLQ
jgi:DNA-binding XRE family transcriptional regulator